MAKKKLELFIDINNERDFEQTINRYADRLICAEIYCSFAGSCTALDRLFTIIKLDWSDGKIILLKVLADEIEALKRFRHQCEPVYMFIINNRVTQVFRGVDGIGFGEVAKKEIKDFNDQQNGVVERPTYALDELTPNEMAWHQARLLEREEETACLRARRAARQAARKRHRAELMVPHLLEFNFILYWPHATHAHPELYERWDMNNIIMIGREEIELTEELANDILYAGDAPLNEASLHALLAGPTLAICLRLLDTDKHFVCTYSRNQKYVITMDALVRKILYSDIPPLDDTKPLDAQFPQKTAFDLYKSYSPTREEVWMKRREERLKQKEEAKEKRARRLSEMQRLARQAIEEAKEAKRLSKERRKLEYLKAGNLQALEKLKQEPDSDNINIVVPEELSEEEEINEEEDPEEYFPPPGLLIPGFYAPPNDVAKTNGLALLFPRLVSEHVTPQPEVLAPHVLVMFEITKRYKVIGVMRQHKSAIIHMGIFKGTSPYDAVHLAYTVRQYDSYGITDENEIENMRLALMLSVESDIPLLELMDLNPAHVSRNEAWGEDECSAMFPVDYADTYPQFEDFFCP